MEETFALPVALTPRIGFLLAVASQEVIERVEEQLAPLGIHSRQYGLLVLLAADGPQTQVALGTVGRIDRTSMVAFVDGLEALKLVTRVRHPQDRRAYLVTLTEAGRALLARATAIVEAAETAALKPLSPAQATQLADLLRTLVRGERP